MRLGTHGFCVHIHAVCCALAINASGTTHDNEVSLNVNCESNKMNGKELVNFDTLDFGMNISRSTDFSKSSKRKCNAVVDKELSQKYFSSDDDCRGRGKSTQETCNYLQ